MKYVEPPHPRQEPRFAGELTGEHIRFLFRDCVDFGDAARSARLVANGLNT